MEDKNTTKINSVDTCPVRALLKYLDKVHKVVSDYILDDNNFPKCMFFQDSSMKDLFNFYPDRIAIDFSFKKFEIDLHMLIFVCEDSNGKSFIVAVGFVQFNEVDSLAWLFKTFKNHNPNWRTIKSVAVDPGIKHIDLVMKSFTSSFIIICSYHAVKAFKSYLSNADVVNNVSEMEKNDAIDLFKNILQASTETEFQVQFQKFQSFPSNLVSSFSEVWLSLKREWKIQLDLAHEDVFKCRNEYLENLNNAIEVIFETEKNYVGFIKKLFLLISLKKRERPNKTLEPTPSLYSRFSTEFQICKTLTPYAAKFVIKQLDLSYEITAVFNTALQNYKFIYLDMEVQACATSCQCNFYQYTLMPCRHMFFVRKANYLCIFDESNIDNMWTRQYYEHASACMEDYLVTSTSTNFPQDLIARENLASHILEVSSPILFNSPRNVYDSRTEVLKNLIQAWSLNEEVSIKFIGIENSVNKKDFNSSKDDSVKQNGIGPISKKVNTVKPLKRTVYSFQE